MILKQRVWSVKAHQKSGHLNKVFEAISCFKHTYI